MSAIKANVENNNIQISTFLQMYAPFKSKEDKKIFDKEYKIELKGEFPHLYVVLPLPDNTPFEFSIPSSVWIFEYALSSVGRTVYYFLKFILQNFFEQAIFDAKAFISLEECLFGFIESKEITKKKILLILLNLKLNKKLSRKESFQEILHRVQVLARKKDFDFLDYLSEDLNPDSLPEEYLKCFVYPSNVLQLIFYFVDSTHSWKDLIQRYSLEQWQNLYNIRNNTHWRKLKMLINKNYEIFMNASNLKEAIQLRRSLRKLNEIVS
jgi:hypothetical protein